jgi:hypothetical protein
MSAEHEQDDPYWTDDQSLAEITLHGTSYGARARIHVSEETYLRGQAKSDLIPISDEPGSRTYVHIHPYLLVPDITLTVGLSPAPTVATAGAIGTVVDAAWHGMRHEQIGSGQAWYYPVARTLILWELDVWGRYLSSAEPTEDGTLRALWHGFERSLEARFPDAARVATPSWEPEVETARWRAFLTTAGLSAGGASAGLPQNAGWRGRVAQASGRPDQGGTGA